MCLTYFLWDQAIAHTSYASLLKFLNSHFSLFSVTKQNSMFIDLIKYSVDRDIHKIKL